MFGIELKVRVDVADPVTVAVAIELKLAAIAGIIASVAELAEDVPKAFVAVAVNVYEVPFVNPVNVYGLLEVV